MKTRFNAPGASAERHRLYVHLPSSLEVDAYREGWKAGVEPDETPYGFHLAESLDYSVEFSKNHIRGKRALQRAADVLRRRAMGIDLIHAWTNRRAIQRADVIWTMLEQEALAISVLMKLRLVDHKPIIAGTVWTLDHWSRLGKLKRLFLHGLFRTWSVLTVHSEECLEIARREVRDVESRLLHFGVSEKSFAPLPLRDETDDGPIVIFAMGNDRTRDWETLLRAFGNDARFRLDIVCRWLKDEAVQEYSNVRIIRAPDMATMRALYAGADYAAVTMHENNYSGITVALEAAALGVPILATRTGGLSTYFAKDEMLLADVHDHVELRSAVLRQSAVDRRRMADRARAKFQAGEYTTLGMMKRYDALTREVRTRSTGSPRERDGRPRDSRAPREDRAIKEEDRRVDSISLGGR